MNIVMFYHSLLSDWNHGNAHFLRGIVTELLARDHRVHVYEPRNAWSVRNLISQHGKEQIDRFREAYPHLKSRRYLPDTLDLDQALDKADLVIVHEWNDPLLVKRIGMHRFHAGKYRLLFHDTHHRFVTDPGAMAAYDLRHFDGVLAFGNIIRDIYLASSWAKRAWAWHEAADIHTQDHNAFNCTPRCILNISRESMARYGFSPATRLFEAAGAGACLITDYWEGIDNFLEQEKEILVAHNGNDVVEHLCALTPKRAGEIGDAAKRHMLAEHTYGHRVKKLEQLLGLTCINREK